MDPFKFSALVVDDEPAIRQLVSRCLATEGFRCDQAHDGHYALGLFELQRYDVVVTDLRMPGEHGYSLIQRVLQSDARPVLVVLTGVTEPRLVRQLLREGIDDVMFKPIALPLFAAKVRVLCESHRKPVRKEAVPLVAAVGSLDTGVRPSDIHEVLPADLAAATDPSADARAEEHCSECTLPGEPSAHIQVAAYPSSFRQHWRQALQSFRQAFESQRCARLLPSGQSFWIVAGLLLAFAVLMAGYAHQGQSSRSLEDRPLTIRGADFTDHEVQQLSRLNNVASLDLGGSAITDQALVSVAKMSNLTILGLRGTRITNAGIKHIRSMPNLTELDVSRTGIGDESLETIAYIPKLKLVDLSGNVLSTPAVQRIRTQRPLLTVIH